MTNAQRQAKWREANRALFNMRRRNARKKNFPVTKAERSGALAGDAPKSGITLGGSGQNLPADTRVESGAKGEATAPVQPFTTKKVGEFRMLVLPKSTETVVTDSKPQVFRNDYGAQISERAWKILQEKKRRAKEGGYELDEYSQ